MKQITARTVEQALMWIDSQPHHMVACEYRPGEETKPNTRPTHIRYENHHERLRVPMSMTGFFTKVEPNHRPFDTRMYRVTKYGRAWLKKQMRLAAGNTIFEELIAEGIANREDLSQPTEYRQLRDYISE